MEPEEKDLLQKTYNVSQENNKILRSIRNSNRVSTLFHAVYWIIIIGISVGAFYYLQPYLNNVLKTYDTIQGDLSTVKSVASKLPTFPTLPTTTTK